MLSAVLLRCLIADVLSWLLAYFFLCPQNTNGFGSPKSRAKRMQWLLCSKLSNSVTLLKRSTLAPPIQVDYPNRRLFSAPPPSKHCCLLSRVEGGRRPRCDVVGEALVFGAVSLVIVAFLGEGFGFWERQPSRVQHFRDETMKSWASRIQVYPRST